MKEWFHWYKLIFCTKIYRQHLRSYHLECTTIKELDKRRNREFWHCTIPIITPINHLSIHNLQLQSCLIYDLSIILNSWHSTSNKIREILFRNILCGVTSLQNEIAYQTKSKSSTVGGDELGTYSQRYNIKCPPSCILTTINGS